HRMSLPELSGALEGAQQDAGRRIDVLALEGCNMGQIEVAAQLRHCAQYLLASPEPVLGTGAPHERLLDLLTKEPAIATRGLIGLSVYVPHGRPEADYLQLNFPRQTGWGEYLTSPRHLR